MQGIMRTHITTLTGKYAAQLMDVFNHEEFGNGLPGTNRARLVSACGRVEAFITTPFDKVSNIARISHFLGKLGPSYLR